MSGLVLLGTPDATIDLLSVELREARPSDFFTKLTSVAPAVHGAHRSQWS